MTPDHNQLPQLEAFEDRTVPAQLGLSLDVELAEVIAHVEVIATVELAPDKSEKHLLKDWLKEESLYVDGPGHSEDAPGHLKKAKKAELETEDLLTKIDETITTVITITIRPRDHDIAPRDGVDHGHIEESEYHILPAEIDGGPGGEAHVHPGWHPLHIGAPVLEAGAEPKPEIAAPAAPTQPAENRPAGNPPTLPVPAAVVPTPAIAGSDVFVEAPPAPAVPAAPNETEVAVGPPPAAPQPPPVEAEPELNWAPVAVQVVDLVSRFVPLDAASVEESVDQFLNHLRESTGFELTPRQIGLLTAALAVGLASGEVARRKHLPQRVRQFISRLK